MSARFALAASALLVVAALSAPAHGHINSPDIFLDERAGPYSLLVIVHMPPAVPGAAELQIRIQDIDARDDGAPIAVLVRHVPPQGEDYSIGWVTAESSRDDPATFTQSIPLMVLGLWQFDVRITGPRGEGRLRVPVSARVAVPSAMPWPLASVLGALGILLLASAAGLGFALGRDAPRPVRVAPTRLDSRRGAVAAAVGTACFALLLIGLGRMWNKQFIRAGRESRPPLSARLTVVAPPAPPRPPRFELAVAAPGGYAPTDVTPDHGKLMHLVVLKLPAMDRFFHIHPKMTAPGRFQFGMAPGGSGDYVLFADLLFADGEGESITKMVTLPDDGLPAGIAGDDADDSFALAPALADSPKDSSVFTSDDGLSFHWQRTTPSLPRMGVFDKLTFEVLDRSGAPAPGGLQPYMGMLGHLLIVRSDAKVFAHVHPMGTLGGRMPAGPHDMASMHTGGADGRVHFPYAFPSPGQYRLFVQVKVDDRVRTGVFDTHVL